MGRGAFVGHVDSLDAQLKSLYPFLIYKPLLIFIVFQGSDKRLSTISTKPRNPMSGAVFSVGQATSFLQSTAHPHDPQLQIVTNIFTCTP